MGANKPWDQYAEYLDLEKILSAQHPQSAAANDPVHDEMLFIQFHQIYELWFKQILFELDYIQNSFSQNTVEDRDMQPILVYLGRIVEILKQMESMIDVLETMPPQSFIDFREYLGTGSGFQSLQFRLIETRLGLRRADRQKVFHGDFDDNLRAESRAAITKAEETPSLFEQLDAWLTRTPFIDRDTYKFWDEYRAAIHAMFDGKETLARANLNGQDLQTELDAIERGRKKFDRIFDSGAHETAGEGEDNPWRMSWKALQAALFITLYGEEPILQAPCRLLTRIMEIDEILARWRFRHALMVQRMVGLSIGTGGSSGYGYLMKTLEKHRIFTDLFALSAYLVPSKIRPPLPETLSRDMGYKHAS